MGLYQHHVFVCTNKRPEGHARGCCLDRAQAGVREYLKERCKALGVPDARVNSAGCLDRCELGPVVVVYPAGEWFRCATNADADVLAAYLAGENSAAIDALRIADDAK